MMRISLYSALAVLSFGLIASQQPAAASTFWTCMSPEFGCGSAGSPSGSNYNYRSRERVYAGDTERRAYRGKSRQTADRAERRAAPVRVASINPRSEQRQVKSDATEAPKQVASVEPRNEGSSVATDVSVRKPQAPDAERKAAVRSAQSGMASYYGNESGSQTASGARFVASAMTAAHRTLPFGTKVRVTNKANGRSVVVTINDRGPFVRGRIIDLSTGAAGVIGMMGAGVAPVTVEVLASNG
jgi:rare lipoprotein A (peptidoglycan hydrolase)